MIGGATFVEYTAGAWGSAPKGRRTHRGRSARPRASRDEPSPRTGAARRRSDQAGRLERARAGRAAAPRPSAAVRHPVTAALIALLPQGRRRSSAGSDPSCPACESTAPRCPPEHAVATYHSQQSMFVSSPPRGIAPAGPDPCATRPASARATRARIDTTETRLRRCNLRSHGRARTRPRRGRSSQRTRPLTTTTCSRLMMPSIRRARRRV